MIELDGCGWAIAILCAFMIGVAKSGVPGLAIMVVPLMAMILPAKQSVGVLLGILVIGDVFVAGYFLMKVVSNQQLRPIIGAVVLVIPSVSYWRNLKSDLDGKIQGGWWFAVGLGFMAGVTSMMANAAGPMAQLLCAVEIAEITG